MPYTEHWTHKQLRFTSADELRELLYAFTHSPMYDIIRCADFLFDTAPRALDGLARGEEWLVDVGMELGTMPIRLSLEGRRINPND